MKQKTSEKGVALLVTLIIITVLLGISSSLLNITLRQYQFSNIGLSSEMAFQAANAGIECAIYHDTLTYPDSKFDVNGDNTGTTSETDINCMNNTSSDLNNPGANLVFSGEEQKFEYTWRTSVASTPQICTSISIYKFYHINIPQDMTSVLGRTEECPGGNVCTVIKSRGYNVPCGSVETPRTIERELLQKY